jgi:hypothetical protein
MLAVTGSPNKSLRALMTGLLDGIDYTTNQASFDLARLRVNGLITASQARTATGSPATGCGSRSSTANCTTGCCVPFLPPTSHPPRHHYEKPCAPSTLTSQNASTPPDCRSMQPETQDSSQ